MSTGVAVVAGCGVCDAGGAATAAVGVGEGVMMITGGAACACDCGACVGAAETTGDALGAALAIGVRFGFADALGWGEDDGDDVEDGVTLGAGVGVGCCAAIVAFVPGSGVKLGSELGACVPDAGLPKNRVSRPPRSRPPRMTKTTSGTIGIPPPFGGSGSSRRRRG
jgi:hypothetical protein